MFYGVWCLHPAFALHLPLNSMPEADARTGGTYLARAADFNRQSGGSTQEIQSVCDGMLWHAMASVYASEFCVLRVFSSPQPQQRVFARARYGE